jgi:phosphatidylserine/phosphatidylglycerophosphate/cardiolipin synthase-like enzyme
VRDGEELWLSSGNMESSSQPEVRPAATGEQSVKPLLRYNREWHVIVKNERLARLLELYLFYDLRTAEANPATPLLPLDEPLIKLERPSPDPDLIEESARARYFARKVIQRDEGAPVTVRPLLTPGNYLEHVIRLVHSARKTLFIQNQSLTLLDPLDKNEDAFVELWQEIRCRQEAGVDVRMIFGICYDEDGAQAVKDRLVRFGFKPECIRAQQRCHTKGLIVDSETVLIGSHQWTSQGVTANRDASFIFHHPEIARYYERIFLFDWKLLARDPGRPSAPQLIGATNDCDFETCWASEGSHEKNDY